MHLVAIGGSDAGISAALRARELDPAAEVTVVVADACPNFSICGIPYYLSGEVPRWQNLAHRTRADLEAAGMRLRLDTTARRIDVAARKLLVTAAGGSEDLIGYDQLVIGTGAVPVQPPIRGLDSLGPADGVHLLHTMGDTFAVMRTLTEQGPASAVIVGAGYVGLEMAEALVTRGLQVTQMEQLPEVLPTVDPELAASAGATLGPKGAIMVDRGMRTGLRDREAGAGFDPVTVESEADDHKAYYPGSHRITMRVTGDRQTGRLLGVQLFGHKNAEIAKRIDIAATAIFHGMTVDALSDLDLSYTPPLGSPWEAVQIGAQAWVTRSRSGQAG
jgi:NADPH-dependent 2,4-dienoyl-CoA reductase/sulfur reductase-like enzyme